MPAIPVFSFGTAAPTSTDVFYEAGTFIRNSAPAIGGVAGWVCTAEGKPGTWKAVGVIDPGTIATVTAAAALSAANKTHNLTGAGPYTLFSAASVAAGAEINIVANAVTVTLVPATSQTLIGGSTLASIGSRWVSNGANTFCRVTG